MTYREFSFLLMGALLAAVVLSLAAFCAWTIWCNISVGPRDGDS